VFLASDYIETAMIYKIMHSKDRRTNGQRTTDEENGASQHHLIYIIHPTWSPFISPDHSSDPKPALSFRCQTNGFAMLYKVVVMFEPGWSGSGRRCTILVTRYLLASRVESEVSNDLKLSSLGSDSISKLCGLKLRKSAQYEPNQLSKDSLCFVMSAIESDSRSAKRFPSRQNSLESVK